MIKKFKYLFLLIFGIILFYPKDTYADGLVNVTSASGSMGYYINGNYGNNAQWSGTFPVELLTSVNDYQKFLYGISTGVPNLSNDYSGTYYTNSVRVVLQLHRFGNQGVIDWNQNVNKQLLCMSNNQEPKYGTCGVKSVNNQYITFECQCSYDHNDYPISADITIGKTSGFTYGTDTYIGRTLNNDSSSLYVQYLQYEATSSNNGSGGGTDLTDTNNKIDDVKDSVDEVKEEVESVGDKIVDDTVPNSTEAGTFFEDLQDINIANPISNLITLPLTFTERMLLIINTGMDDGCYPVKLITFSGPWFDDSYDVYLPCFDGEQIFGRSIWYVIDMLICFYMVYNIVMLFIDIYHDFITLSVGLSASSHIMNTNSTQTSPYSRR